MDKQVENTAVQKGMTEVKLDDEHVKTAGQDTLLTPISHHYQGLSSINKSSQGGGSKKKRRSRGSRSRRIQRLHLYHEKLVEERGLPPSKLMLQQDTPKYQSTGIQRRRFDFQP